MVSIIIPARDEPYLQKTVDSAFDNATGEIQVVVLLDGWWPDQVPDRPGLVIVHKPTPEGMRSAINAAAAVATGTYLMKADAHCAFSPGFDTALIAAHSSGTVLVPVRRALDVCTWTAKGIDRCQFQYIRQEDFKGKDWPEYEQRVAGQECPELMTMQGSCWFMLRADFWAMEGLDAENYGSMGREAQEIACKTWLSDRVLRLCRSAWYAHWSKDTGLYKNMSGQRNKSMTFACACWKNDKWPRATKKLQWLIDHFAPVPSWHGHAPGVTAAAPAAPAVIATPAGVPGLPTTGERLPYIATGFNRAGLYRYFASLGFKVGAEVGVFLAENAKTMFRNIPDLHLHLVEPHADYPLSSRHYGERMMRVKDRAERRLRNRKCTWHTMLSEDAAREVPDGSLDFVYIDGDHTYDFCMLDIILWWRKVRKGGIVSGHDYFLDPRKERHAKVSAAVNDYTRIHRIDPWYITDTTAAEQKGDRYASWFFQKPVDKWPNQ